MSDIKKCYLDKETILKIYKVDGIVGVINTYHNSDVLVILDDFADEVDTLIEEESDTLLYELTDKIKKEI